MLHQFPAGCIGAHRYAAADDFTEGYDVCPNAEEFLSTALCQAEAGDHLVKDQQSTIFCADAAQTLEKALVGAHNTHVCGHRLYDYAGYLVGIFVEKTLYTSQIVILGSEGILGSVSGNAGRTGTAACHSRGAGLTSIESEWP